MMNEAKMEDQLLLASTSSMALSVLSTISNRSIVLIRGITNDSTINALKLIFPDPKLIFVPQKLINIRHNIITAYLRTGNFRKFQYNICMYVYYISANLLPNLTILLIILQRVQYLKIKTFLALITSI